ncbi:MAG: PEP-CTERM sorting domain-containing protein [Akkermansiaceae bacterium]
MKIINNTKVILASVLSSLCVSSGLNAQSVNFDLSYASSSGASYRNISAGDASSLNIEVSAFEIEINQIGGESVSFENQFAAFCIEIGETIAEGNFTYDFESLEGISSGRAGVGGTATSEIPAGGIGDLAAARVRALFDKYYQSDDLSEWGYSDRSPLAQAFQLAIWEISHDGDLSLSDTSGAFYIGRQSDGNNTQKNGIDLAQSWLNELSSITADYESQKWDVYALESIGNPGYQDLVFATEIGTVPEPSSALLLSLGGLATLVYRRR